MIRTGIGFDAHQLVSGRRLVLGGVQLDYPKGLDGHSDADVLTHAVADAILGAVALGDIGRIFPDTDPEYRDADSLDILAKTRELVESAGYRVVNVDATVIAEAPMLAPHIGEMQANLSTALKTDPGAVSVKATTTEGMGFTGRREGITALATALVESI